MQLCVVVPVPDYRVAAASRATDALWPAVLAHHGEALRIVEQGCEVDRVRCGHDDRNPSCSPATADRLEPSSYPNRHNEPPSPRKPTRALVVRSGLYAGSGSRVLTDATGERRNRQFCQPFRGLRSCRPNPSGESGLKPPYAPPRREAWMNSTANSPPSSTVSQ